MMRQLWRAAAVEQVPSGETGESGLAFPRCMTELIDRMRMRVRQMRRLKSLAHDPEMVAIIDRVIEEGERDIRKLEAEAKPKD